LRKKASTSGAQTPKRGERQASEARDTGALIDVWGNVSAVNAREWTDAYADRLGTPAPSASEFAAILDLAAEAAHASERVAAPVACWLSARSGVSLEESLARAREVGQGGAGDRPDRGGAA
jgi:hypothetical protein